MQGRQPIPHGYPARWAVAWTDDGRFVGGGFGPGLGADVIPEQWDLFEPPWPKLKALGGQIYADALLGPIHGAMIGLNQAETNFALGLLANYGVHQLYRQLMGIYPIDHPKLAEEQTHLWEKSLANAGLLSKLFEASTKGRDTLIRYLLDTGNLTVSEPELKAIGAKQGWSQQQLVEAWALAKAHAKMQGPKKGQTVEGLDGGGGGWVLLALLALLLLRGAR